MVPGRGWSKSTCQTFTWHGEDVEEVVAHQKLHLAPLFGPLTLLVGHLIAPQPVLVVAGEAIHHDRDG